MIPCLLLTASLAAAPSLDFERYTLPNGLTVILYEDHRLPSVTVNLWFHVGSADEAPGRSGFAHLFEHLMFMGTAAIPNGEFDGVMEQAGGFNNATTNTDRTNYFESGPANLLETFLWLEGDRLAHLGEDMTQAKLDLQRDVVKNERRQSVENRPYGRTEMVIVDKLFPPGHPYHHPVIGSHADLSAAKVDDVKAFFRTWYVPANASLVIAGDFDPVSAKALIAKYLATIPRAEPPLHVTPPEVELKAPVRVDLKDRVTAARVVLAWPTPAGNRKGSAEVELLAWVLGAGKGSRLHRALVLEQQLASEVEVEVEQQFGPGVLVVTATAQQGRSAAELERALNAELVALNSTRPVAEVELTRARSLFEVKTLGELEATLARADRLNALETELGDPGLLWWSTVDRFDRVSISGLQEAARRLARPHLTLTFMPDGAHR
jgi:zinc protease